jgi:hypothetical protein
VLSTCHCVQAFSYIEGFVTTPLLSRPISGSNKLCDLQLAGWRTESWYLAVMVIWSDTADRLQFHQNKNVKHVAPNSCGVQAGTNRNECSPTPFTFRIYQKQRPASTCAPRTEKHCWAGSCATPSQAAWVSQVEEVCLGLLCVLIYYVPGRGRLS